MFKIRINLNYIYSHVRIHSVHVSQKNTVVSTMDVTTSYSLQKESAWIVTIIRNTITHRVGEKFRIFKFCSMCFWSLRHPQFCNLDVQCGMLERLCYSDWRLATLSREVRGLFQSLRMCLTNCLFFSRTKHGISLGRTSQ